MEKDYFSHLSSEEKHILKDKGTEAPFSGEYDDFFQAGIFVCRACENPLYESNSKFNSGCGWPSFDEGMKGSIKKYKDLSGGRIRTEICCKKCDGHLGHVFEGEQITAKNTRHCVNSLSIKFIAHNNLKVATFGAGCFWHVEKTFRETKGVCLASVGYNKAKHTAHCMRWTQKPAIANGCFSRNRPSGSRRFIGRGHCMLAVMTVTSTVLMPPRASCAGNTAPGPVTRWCWAMAD